MEPLQSRVVSIPRGYNASQRVRIGQDIILRIKRRTSAGLDVSGNLFAGYSPNYEKTGQVDLDLTGSMLNSLVVLSTGPGFVRIGFNSPDANDKAAWIQSPRGQKLGKQPVREFVGISAGDLNTILERHPL